MYIVEMKRRPRAVLSDYINPRRVASELVCVICQALGYRCGRQSSLHSSAHHEFRRVQMLFTQLRSGLLRSWLEHASSACACLDPKVFAQLECPLHKSSYPRCFSQAYCLPLPLLRLHTQISFDSALNEELCLQRVQATAATSAVLCCNCQPKAMVSNNFAVLLVS